MRATGESGCVYAVRRRRELCLRVDAEREAEEDDEDDEEEEEGEEGEEEEGVFSVIGPTTTV